MTKLVSILNQKFEPKFFKNGLFGSEIWRFETEIEYVDSQISLLEAKTENLHPKILKFERKTENFERQSKHFGLRNISKLNTVISNHNLTI